MTSLKLKPSADSEPDTVCPWIGPRKRVVLLCGQIDRKAKSRSSWVLERMAGLFATLAVILLATGCTTTITNLTPRVQARTGAGLYPFEVALTTRERTIRKETITPYVLIGMQSYAMQAAPVLSNRWETLIPIPADQSSVAYRFKFVYKYAGLPQPWEDSKLSQQYRLEIQDRR